MWQYTWFGLMLNCRRNRSKLDNASTRMFERIDGSGEVPNFKYGRLLNLRLKSRRIELWEQSLAQCPYSYNVTL